MYVMTRRSFLAGTAIVPFSTWLERTAAAQGSQTYVRYDARSQQGQAMLKTYAQAVAKMKKTTPGDPRSWVFQWYTHWVKGPGAPFNAVVQAKNGEIQRIYQSSPQYRELAQEMWDNCEAHGMGIIPPGAMGFPPQDENFFLPWHRLFVYFFERIVRSVSSPSFTLPYWNYSTSNQAIRGVIPPEFTRMNDPNYSALFVQNRNQGVNQGEPIQDALGGPGDPLSLEALTQPTYEPNPPLAGFCQQLDFGLHGNVHVGVGNQTNMGNVPTAANDPIFWMHHSNIDRLWASWNAGGRQNPSRDQTFVFADVTPQGTVQRVVMNASDVMDIARLGYSYDRLEQVPGVPEAAMALAARRRTPKSRAVAQRLTLGAAPLKTTLEPVPEAPGVQPPAFNTQVGGLPNTSRIFLVVRDLQTNAPPGVLYNVYIDLPAGATPQQALAHRVGVLNFFHALGHAGAGHEAAAPARAAGHADGKGMFLSFDVTNVARSLQANGRLGEKPTLTIAPAGKPAADAQPVVGEVSLVEV